MTTHNAELAQIGQAKRDLTGEERIQFDLMYGQHRRDPAIVHLISLLGGIVGLDRFYLNKTGSGYGKLFTLGGLFIWALIDVFTIRGLADEYNAELAERVHTAIVAAR